MNTNKKYVLIIIEIIYLLININYIHNNKIEKRNKKKHILGKF